VEIDKSFTVRQIVHAKRTNRLGTERVQGDHSSGFL
jgi:hypothetical protein